MYSFLNRGLCRPAHQPAAHGRISFTVAAAGAGTRTMRGWAHTCHQAPRAPYAALPTRAVNYAMQYASPDVPGPHQYMVQRHSGGQADRGVVPEASARRQQLPSVSAVRVTPPSQALAEMGPHMGRRSSVWQYAHGIVVRGPSAHVARVTMWSRCSQREGAGSARTRHPPDPLGRTLPRTCQCMRTAAPAERIHTYPL
jgi:hypothetical protein